MHLDDERLQRLLDDELDPAATTRARLHLADCDACSGRLDALAEEAREVAGLLAPLDHDPPPMNAERLIGRTASGTRRLRRAAAVLLALGGAGAAYALPGSPLRAWVDALAQRFTRQAPAMDTPAFPAPPAGISVDPGNALVIEFSGTRPGTFVEVALVEAAVVAVRAPAGTAAFSHDEGRLAVRDRGAGAYEVDIPRTAPRVEIRADGRVVFTKAGDRITLIAADTTATGFHVPLSRR